MPIPRLLSDRSHRRSPARPAVLRPVRLAPSLGDRCLYVVRDVGTLRVTGWTWRTATAEAGGRSWQIAGRHVVADSAYGDNPHQEPVWSKIVNEAAINLVGHSHVYDRLSAIDSVNVIVSGVGKDGLRPLGIQHHNVVTSENRVPDAPNPTKATIRLLGELVTGGAGSPGE